jgi:ribonuclease HI
MDQVDQEQTGRLQSPDEEEEGLTRAFVYTDASWGNKIGTWAAIVHHRDEENLLNLDPVHEHGIVPPPYTGAGACELYAIRQGLRIANGLGVDSINLYTDQIDFERCLNEHDPAFGGSQSDGLYRFIKGYIENIQLYVHYTNSDSVCVNQMLHKLAHVYASNRRRIELREHKAMLKRHEEYGREGLGRGEPRGGGT